MALRATREIRVPFHFGADGAVAVVNNDVEAAGQHIETVLRTQPKERVMRPDFGTPSNAYLFELNDPLMQSDVVQRVQRSLARFEPGIRVVSVDIEHSDVGVASFLISFVLAPRTDVYTASVSLGGSLNGEIVV